MATQYHSKICAHAHNAMEELFGAGLLDPQSMYHFDVLCRSDAKSHAQAPSQSPVPPWFVERREEAAVPKKAPAPAPMAQVAPKAKPAPQPARTTSIKAPTASASYATATGASATPRKEAQVQAARPAAAPRAARPAPIAPVPSPNPKKDSRPRTPAPSPQPLQPKPHPVLPKADEWQFSENVRSFQSAALATARQPAPAGAFKQSPPRQRGAAELRQLREREGVSEAVFARCLGVPPQTVIAWESGIVLPSPKVSRMLAAIEENGLNAVG